MTDGELHSTHRWGERPLYERDETGTVHKRMIPSCRSCKVDGFENEPDAFLPCPKVKTGECGAKMKSTRVPGHVHVCGIAHPTGDHHCVDPDCLRWFWFA